MASTPTLPLLQHTTNTATLFLSPSTSPPTPIPPHSTPSSLIANKSHHPLPTQQQQWQHLHQTTSHSPLPAPLTSVPTPNLNTPPMHPQPQHAPAPTFLNFASDPRSDSHPQLATTPTPPSPLHPSTHFTNLTSTSTSTTLALATTRARARAKSTSVTPPTSPPQAPQAPQAHITPNEELNHIHTFLSNPTQHLDTNLPDCSRLLKHVWHFFMHNKRHWQCHEMVRFMTSCTNTEVFRSSFR
jgi:hypothetical protein